MTEDYFYDQMKPVKNHLDENSAFDGFMFETYGPEVEYVRCQDPDKVWTIVETEGQMSIIPGFHIVNRIGYMLTQVKHEGESYVEMEDLEEFK
jgi:hypothetical protein